VAPRDAARRLCAGDGADGHAAGPIIALAFVSNSSHPSYVGELPLDETAAMIASGKGILGTNREYLVQLATQLEALGIEDPYVAQLHAAIGATPDM
jgi:cation transport protein ChaC